MKNQLHLTDYMIVLFKNQLSIIIYSKQIKTGKTIILTQ